MTKVKICGITNLEDAHLAVKLGANLLGFNFYEKSPRYVAPESASKIVSEMPKDVVMVGVFVNATIETIVRVAHEADLDAIQLHGDEEVPFIDEARKQTGLEIIKAIRVGPDFEIGKIIDYPVDAILLDSYSASERGGTGKTFAWKIAHEAQFSTSAFIYLAGGLSAENVSQAIREAEPFGVDVCSGVESRPGKKDAVKLKQFIDSVRETI